MSGQLSGMEALREIPVWAWFILVTLLLCQATWIFNDAKRRGYNAWAWGALGLLNVPSSLIIYYLVVGTREGSGWAKRPRETNDDKPPVRR